MRALEVAYENGVTWFDLAPAYGLGQAEEIAATFLRGRRDRVQVATKVGLVAPEKVGRLPRALLPIARQAVGAVPPLRRFLRRAGLHANQKLRFTPQLLQTSLESSLRRLGTDYVDLYALHNADPADLGRDDLRRTLEGILSAGKARAIAVASDEEAARFALTSADPGPVSFIQIPLPPPGEPAPILSEARAHEVGTIVHSVFGMDSKGDLLLARLASNADLRREVARATGTCDLRTALARLRLARAFALVPDGVVLVSMFSEHSRRENLAVATGNLPAGAAELLDRIVGSSRDPSSGGTLPTARHSGRS